MANRDALRREFFARYPLCCFCGGTEPAVTEDHQPARSIFDERKWPEGYSFPACEKCNQVSRVYENVFAVLVRVGAGLSESGVQRAEFEKLLDAATNNFPGLLQRMTTNDKRRFYRSEGLAKPLGVAFSEINMCAIDSGLTEDAITMILRKLFSALHYKHTGSILPADGRIFVRWITNAYTHRGDGFQEFVSMLSGRPNLIRTKVSLHDQFDYIFETDPAGSSFSAFFCFFRTSFAGYGPVFDSAKTAEGDFDPAELHGPFTWTDAGAIGR
jgi:hypothetical protein